jgi:hypothetical protein
MLKYDIDERITMSAALDHDFFALIPNRKRHKDDSRRVK